MPLPELCLLPHEVGDLAPDEPLCAPAMLRARAWRWFSMSFYNARWIGLANGKFDLVARREVPDAPLMRFAFGMADNAPCDFPHLAKLIGRGDFMRCLFFGADQKLIETRGNWHGELILSPDGRSCWQSPNGEIAPFEWRNLKARRPMPDWWRARATDAQIEAEVCAMLRDEASDCAFAWAWLHWSERQRGRVWARAGRGDLDACERVVRAIVRADSTWQSEPSRDLNFDLSVLDFPFAAETSINGHLLYDAKSQEFSASQNRLFRLVFEQLGLSLNRSMESYSAARHYSHRHGSIWRLTIALPSQHERLEALFEVRDWLRDKVSSTELTELMPA